MSENIDSIIPEEIAVEDVAVEAPAVEEQEVIAVPEVKETSAEKDLGALDNGAIGTKKAKVKTEKPKEETKAVATGTEETVAIYTTRNVTWEGVGKIFVGYNIVTPKQAESWLTRGHVRLATPEEVAKEFNA